MGGVGGVGVGGGGFGVDGGGWEWVGGMGEDLSRLGDGGFQIVVNYNAIVFIFVFHFGFGGGEASRDDIGSVLSAAVESLAEDVYGGWAEEDGDGVWCGVFDLPCALAVDFQQDIISGCELFLHPLGAGSVEVAVDLGGFQKKSVILHPDELIAPDEKVLPPVLLAGPGRARGMRDGDPRQPVRLQAAGERSFPGPRGSRQNKKATEHRSVIITFSGDRFHSTIQISPQS